MRSKGYPKYLTRPTDSRPSIEVSTGAILAKIGFVRATITLLDSITHIWF